MSKEDIYAGGSVRGNLLEKKRVNWGREIDEVIVYVLN